jgi:hypothetical protein
MLSAPWNTHTHTHKHTKYLNEGSQSVERPLEVSMLELYFGLFDVVFQRLDQLGLLLSFCVRWLLPYLQLHTHARCSQSCHICHLLLVA